MDNNFVLSTFWLGLNESMLNILTHQGTLKIETNLMKLEAYPSTFTTDLRQTKSLHGVETIHQLRCNAEE